MGVLLTYESHGALYKVHTRSLCSWRCCFPEGLRSWRPVFLEALILVLYSCFPGGFRSWKPWYRQYYWHCIPVFLIIPPPQRAEPEYSSKDNKIKISNPIVISLIKYYCNNAWTEVWLWHWLVSLSSNNWTSSLPPLALSLRTWNIQIEDNCEPLICFAEINRDFLITHFYSQPLSGSVGDSFRLEMAIASPSFASLFKPDSFL